MGQIAKMEVEEKIKSCGETFYEIFRSKQYLLPKICADLIKEGKVIYGDWRAVGSIKEWTYVAGNCETSKETVEAIDEAKKSITFKVLEGGVSKYYNNVRSTIEVNGSSVKWSIEYEKKSDDFPNPTLYLSLFAKMIQNVDNYLTSTAHSIN